MACRRAHRLAVAAALGLSALACLVPATAADWPQFGRTPRHTNANPSERAFTPENVATLEVKWNADMGANVAVQGGPVIAGGGLFVAGFDGMLKAYDIAGCGAAVCPPLWQGRTDNDITTTPAVLGSVEVSVLA